MPSNDDWADDLGWSDDEERLFQDLGGEDLLSDGLLQQAFHIGWFDLSVDHDYRAAAREYVVEWLAVEYGIDFVEEFDWDAWREAYSEL